LMCAFEWARENNCGSAWAKKNGSSSPRLRGSSVVLGAPVAFWIPTFVGMTVWDVLGVLRKMRSFVDMVKKGLLLFADHFGRE
jgi:hypothetical protein